MCVECVLVWNCFQNVWKLLKMYLFFFFFFFFILPCTPARPREANQADFWYIFVFTFGMAPEMRKSWNGTKKSKWRPRLAQASGLAGHVPLSSKGKIAKRVVWMIALAGCAQAGWIARGTRPEQGEPIYILCNFYNVHSMTHLVLLFFNTSFMLVGDVRKCTFTVYNMYKYFCSVILQR